MTRFIASSLRYAMLVAVVAAVTACETPPPRRVHPYRTEQVPPAPPPPQTQVYFYPTAGQTAQQQSRDRYECYLWAVKQSGFDPSLPSLAPHQRVEYVPRPPPGQNTVAGAITGAVVGAAVSRPRDAGAGAVVGAVAGGILGAAADSANQAEADRVQSRYDRRNAQRDALLEQQAQSYRRAMSACLEGRGYAVE